jgi:hypothetical protein
MAALGRDLLVEPMVLDCPAPDCTMREAGIGSGLLRRLYNWRCILRNM